MFIEKGLGPKQIQKIMGHASIEMTFDTYGHLFDNREAERDAVDAIEADLLMPPAALRDKDATGTSKYLN